MMSFQQTNQFNFSAYMHVMYVSYFLETMSVSGEELHIPFQDKNYRFSNITK